MASKVISNVSKMVHDKVAYSGPYKPFKYRCDNDLNALTVNKDFTQVVVAGRAVFKVLSIKEDCFADVANLRTNKSRQDPVYCISDVTWHPHDENILASAATNGSVVVWSINTKRKEMVFNDHKRSVNRVTFHGSEPNQLLSASQDGVVMIHDIRQQNVCIKFGTPGNDSVKDAQFCPPTMGFFTFAAAYGNSVQIWDMRRPERFERHFMAHNGPVYTLDWHPTDKHTLATAGRDKMIKVWDLSVNNSSNRSNLFSIQNIAPVAHIKWRPQRKHHIASCSLQLDNSINVWDVNRPYIPFARFEGHDNTATWIKWREDCHTFLTVGKDGHVIQHVFADAKRPADDLNLAAVDMSINGHIGYINSEPTDPIMKSKKVSRRSQFSSNSQSSMCMFEDFYSADDEKDPSNSLFLTEEEQFIHLAQRYQLDGGSFVDMCQHNSHVAATFQNHEVADSWRMVATLLSTSTSPSRATVRTTSLTTPNPDKEYPNSKEHTMKSALKYPRDKVKNGLIQQQDHVDVSGSNDESSEVEGETSEVDKSPLELNQTTSVLFGEGGMDGNSAVWYRATDMLDHSYYTEESIGNIPTEGFRVQHKLQAMTGMMPVVMDDWSHHQHHGSLDSDQLHNIPSVTITNTATTNGFASDSHLASQHPSLFVKGDTVLPLSDAVDFTDVIAYMIKNYAEKGDVQTVVTMLIVIGDVIRPYLEEAYQESWFFSYIEMLGQFELWKIANDVIKHSKLLGVCGMNQESTVIHTFCTMCSRPMERSAWLCDKCKRVTNLCSICHYPVKGGMAWCQGCGHGGHKDHIEAWLLTSPMCPAGCGHQCEYV